MAFFFVGDAATDPQYEAGRNMNSIAGSAYHVRPPRATAYAIRICASGNRSSLARRSPAADEVRFSPVWEENVHYFRISCSTI